MALHWNLGDIADYKETCFREADYDRPHSDIKKGDRVMSPVTNTLIWATIPVGINHITEANAETFSQRLRAYENAFGCFLQQPVDKDGNPVGPKGREEDVVSYKDRRITFDEVKAHIGLSTNASTLTDAKFKAGLGERLLREARDSIRFEREKAAKAA
jgi:hypothetical protein